MICSKLTSLLGANAPRYFLRAPAAPLASSLWSTGRLRRPNFLLFIPNLKRAPSAPKNFLFRPKISSFKSHKATRKKSYRSRVGSSYWMRNPSTPLASVRVTFFIVPVSLQCYFLVFKILNVFENWLQKFLEIFKMFKISIPKF